MTNKSTDQNQEAQTEASWHLEWEKGGFANLVEMNDKKMVFLSSIPCPPGSRIAGFFLLASFPEDSAKSRRLDVKVFGSKKQVNGNFLVEGRPVDLLSSVREWMKSLL